MVGEGGFDLLESDQALAVGNAPGGVEVLCRVAPPPAEAECRPEAHAVGLLRVIAVLQLHGHPGKYLGGATVFVPALQLPRCPPAGLVMEFGYVGCRAGWSSASKASRRLPGSYLKGFWLSSPAGRG